MFVGVLQIDLLLRGNTSLKQKRQTLKSIKDRTRRKFNISVAEVDHHDLWQRAVLAVCCVSNDKIHVNQMLSEVVKFIESNFPIELLDYQIEIL
ncbi:MAG: DUF503 domain-containing protein [Candidatus Abyssobacteria bacterium SURF_5]|uniref:DUF503 domain-containing protein n=1 Tax=Abyssobacteria bacterium (strain SURF_5) TaxID=2093360 RepID=A0A3A4NQF8_ABYX5|nr:MAG: DUF503 domain-containing protein [Candidatus Abyssubacteria bacterium SURF_5]